MSGIVNEPEGRLAAQTLTQNEIISIIKLIDVETERLARFLNHSKEADEFDKIPVRLSFDRLSRIATKLFESVAANSETIHIEH